MKQHPLTPDVVEAYHHCVRKAYLILRGEHIDCENPYAAMLDEASRRCRALLAEHVLASFPAALRCTPSSLAGGALIDAPFEHENLRVVVDALLPAKKGTERTPVIASAHRRVVDADKVRLAFVSSALARIQQTTQRVGGVFTSDGKMHRVKLDSMQPVVDEIVTTLRGWTAGGMDDEPPVALNRHCPECQFHDTCRKSALRDDNLTLLRGITAKRLERYKKKGVFTITQLSYQFHPRKGRARVDRQPIYRPELQALALRTGKTYVVEPPEIARSGAAIYLDFEGVPETKFYYLAGLLVSSEGVQRPHSFWADSPEQEEALWKGVRDIVGRFPDAPIFHYGGYDSRACRELAKRYGGSDPSGRLVNVLSAVYGRVYFPIYGNGLKEVGTHLGISWPPSLDSGLRALMWRQRWEWTKDVKIREQLIQYNLRDCYALRAVASRLTELSNLIESDPSLELADDPKKHATAAGADMHEQFDRVLLMGHAKYQKKRISFSTSEPENEPGKLEGLPARRTRAKAPRPTRTVEVAPRRKCPRCKSHNIVVRRKCGSVVVVDITFSRNGCRKTVTRFTGPLTFCRDCRYLSNPARVQAHKGNRYGHRLGAYIAYQRMGMRLSTRTISSSLDELHDLKIRSGTVDALLKRIASAHALTERRLLKNLLAAPHVHCDETKVNIEGENHYVWVITDGAHVVLKSTQTRSADWIKGVLTGYPGILVSDFYAGYDSVDCRQQKCLSHLVRDMNEDLWKEPFNGEYEEFAGNFKSLIVTIMETVQRYGLKGRNLNKHRRSVETFYRRWIDGAEYSQDTTRKYQKRFERYRNSMFAFLEGDEIPWNNNMAERALRHLAIQRKISGSFGKEGIHRYLQLLSISQTCRFQDKSFLRFLLSGGKDVDGFDASSRRKKR